MDFTLKLPFARGVEKDPAPPYIGPGRDLFVGKLHGDYHEISRRGRLYVATSATGGIALIVAATTGGHPTLINPIGSGRVLSIRKLALAYVSGNNAPGSISWNSIEDVGAQAATGVSSPILTAVPVAMVPSRLGGPVDHKGIWSPTTNTFTAAPAFYRPANLSLFTGVAATAVAPFTWGEEYDGDLEIAPGNALALVSQQATTTALFRVMLLVEEIDDE